MVAIMLAEKEIQPSSSPSRPASQSSARELNPSLDINALKLTEMGYVPSLKGNYSVFSMLGVGLSLLNSWFAISAALNHE